MYAPERRPRRLRVMARVAGQRRCGCQGDEQGHGEDACTAKLHTKILRFWSLGQRGS